MTLGAAASLLDLHGDELRRALAVAHDGVGERAGRRRRPRSDNTRSSGASSLDGGIAQRPRRDQDARIVGGRIAVDGDAVEAPLDRVRAPSGAAPRGSTAASVAMKASIVAMSGRIIPEPLAIPVTTAPRSPRSTDRDAPLGTMSVVDDGGTPRRASRASSQPPGGHRDRPLEPLDGQRLADDPGRERQDALGRRSRWPRRPARSTASRPRSRAPRCPHSHSRH